MDYIVNGNLTVGNDTHTSIFASATSSPFSLCGLTADSGLSGLSSYGSLSINGGGGGGRSPLSHISLSSITRARSPSPVRTRASGRLGGPGRSGLPPTSTRPSRNRSRSPTGSGRGGRRSRKNGLNGRVGSMNEMGQPMTITP